MDQSVACRLRTGDIEQSGIEWIDLGRKTRRTLTGNLAIAFGAITLMVGTILLQGIPLSLAVIGHEGSTMLVPLNGLRLLRFRG